MILDKWLVNGDWMTKWTNMCMNIIKEPGPSTVAQEAALVLELQSGKDHNCIFTFSREKMLFFSALLFLTDSKYPLCSFFIEKIFFLFIPTSFPLWRPHKENTSFLNAMGPRRLSLLIVEGSGCRHRAYSPAPPNLHVYNCYQNCCGKI